MTNETSLDAVLDAITHALEGVEGYDGAVHRGRVGLKPPKTPWAAISAAAVSSQQGPIMGEYLRQVVVDIEVWGNSTSLDQDARVRESEALMDRLVDALDEERARTSSALFALQTFAVTSAVPDDFFARIATTTTFVVLSVEGTYSRARGLSGVSP